MKTEWMTPALRKIGEVMHQTHYCISCDHHCKLVLPLSEEPPESCIKKLDNVLEGISTVS